MKRVVALLCGCVVAFGFIGGLVTSCHGAVSAVAAGDGFSLYVTTDGTLWSLGSNGSGQLGDGTKVQRSATKQIASDVRAVAAGSRHSLFLKNNGTLWATGENGSGQLGDGTTILRTSPVQVASGVQSIAARYSHSFFVKTDGTLWAMGDNSNGQLGIGNSTSRPIQVASGVSSVTAGAYHSMFVKIDGTLWAMGGNYHGELGDGSKILRRTPQQVSTGVSSAAAGAYMSFFVKTDGTLWAMGYNAFGQLGDGTSIDRAFPVQVASGVRTVSAGSYFSLFVKADGTLWAMGDNSDGQLGDGSTIDRFAPVKVASGVAIAAGSSAHSLFTTTDGGTLWAMGSNSSGQLGDGTFTRRFTPVTQAPTVVIQPNTQAVTVGGSVTFTVAATGNAPLLYQWFKDGAAITGATAASYSLNPATILAAGIYTVTVSNSFGRSTSGGAQLAFLNTGRLINLSILTALSATGDSFTMGYVVGGAGTVGAKPLVIRAAGPSLGALGVPGTISDPKLELFAGATKTDENDNWGGSGNLTAALAAVGAFAYLGPNSKDAAITGNITSRDNSVVVSAPANDAGQVIAEIYDATPTAAFGPSTPRLINVSVRKHLGTGLTVGFVLGGSSPTKVLIRAVGPTLGGFGVPDVVTDPQLTLFDGTSTKIGENNDWSGTAELTAAFGAVGAFALPATSKDAALLVTLPPGNYSVQASGTANTTGVALVEVYEVP